MNQRIERAFDAVARENFLPPAQRRNVALDQPLHLVAGQTCSQPTTVRHMLELLAPQPGHHVLDVGSGSGWTTALLAELVGDTGSVVGVELLPELAEWGRENVARTGMTWADVHVAQDGVLGWPDEAPYDRVLVSAEAKEVPARLGAQLAEGGRMVIPVRGRMTVVENHGGDVRVVREVGSYRFVPLVETHRARHRRD